MTQSVPLKIRTARRRPGAERPHADGLARLQGQSRIPASTWRRWCALLELPPRQAIELWEEICWPITIASGQRPEVAYILQLRAARADLDIPTFREELAPLLHLTTFFNVLADPYLDLPHLPAALLRYYKYTIDNTFRQPPFNCLMDQFAYDTCRALIVVKVASTPDITLSRVLKLLGEGRASLEHLVHLACSAPGDGDLAGLIREFLRPETRGETSAEEEIEVERTPGQVIEQFRRILQTLYETEFHSEREKQGSLRLLERRLKAIRAFDPFKATIPGLEEAQALARRNEVTPRKPTSKQPAPVSLPKNGATSKQPTPDPSPTNGDLPTPRPAAPTAPPQPVSIAQAADVDIDADAIVSVQPAQIEEFDQVVRYVSQLLAKIEVVDQKVWSLFLEPSAEIDDLPSLTRQLADDEGSVHQAGDCLLQAARYLPFKELIPNTRRMLKEPPLTLQVTSFVNYVGNNGRHQFTPDDRKIASLGKLLDHAAAAFLRLQALKTAHDLFEREEGYSTDAVVSYYEKALFQVTARIDHDLLTRTRTRADANVQVLLEQFNARKFAEKLLTSCRAYAEKLRDEQHTRSLEQIQTAVEADPLILEEPDISDADEPGSELLLSEIIPSDLGEIFDAVSTHILTRAWKVMRPIHDPSQVIMKLERILGEILVDSLMLSPARRRHQENPLIPLQVVGLDKLNRDANFKDFFVRVGENGRIATVEDFEDGRYVDLFELRTYTPSRVHAAAQKKKEEEGEVELQTGRQYLFSVGRTCRLFGRTPGELVNSCIKADSGMPQIFPLF